MMEESQLGLHKTEQEFTLRTATIADAQMITHYFQNNRAFLKPWEPVREEEFFTVEGWTKKLIKLEELHRMNLGFYCLLIDVETQQMLGTISFSNVSRFPFHACSVGYSLAESAQGKGYMRRGLKLACEYMFKIQNMHRIQAAYMPHNQRSEAVLNALGFVREGYAQDYLLIDGEWRDHVLMSLTHQDWSPRS